MEMRTHSVLTIQKILDEANVRFIFVGGLAVAAHGFARFTKDADIVLELVPDNIIRAFKALATIGYKPNVPIDAESFADANLRNKWHHEKGMLVLQFWSDQHRETKLDVFIEHPFDFDEEWKNCHIAEESGVRMRYATIPTLIAMKQKAGRDQDLRDIKELTLIADIKKHGK